MDIHKAFKFVALRAWQHAGKKGLNKWKEGWDNPYEFHKIKSHFIRFNGFFLKNELKVQWKDNCALYRLRYSHLKNHECHVYLKIPIFIEFLCVHAWIKHVYKGVYCYLMNTRKRVITSSAYLGLFMWGLFYFSSEELNVFGTKVRTNHYFLSQNFIEITQPKPQCVPLKTLNTKEVTTLFDLLKMLNSM